MKEDWQNPWYVTWRFSRLSKPARAAVMAYINTLKEGAPND